MPNAGLLTGSHFGTVFGDGFGLEVAAAGYPGLPHLSYLPDVPCVSGGSGDSGYSSDSLNRRLAVSG